MIGIIRKIKEHFQERRAHKAFLEAKAMLESPNLFSKEQREVLYALFPKAWTHMDNFTQEEIFQIAITMSLFGMSCDSPEKLKNVLELLTIQKIFIAHGANPLVLKRA